MVRARWTRVGAAVVGIVGLAGTLVWALGRHTIVYRVSAPRCEARVEYKTADGYVETRVRDEQRFGPFVVWHGAVANVSVFAGPGCVEPVACVLVEDGVEVAASHGLRGAVCSSLTSR